MTIPLLEIRDLQKTFPVGGHKVHALDCVSLSVPEFETLAIVGESGSGKSTLANIIVGALGADAGSVTFDGVELRPDRTAAQRQQISLVQQNPYSALNPRRSIGSAIELPLIVHGVGTRHERRDRVEELLQMVQLPSDFRTRSPASLSGGQRQRVAIARAIATNPKLLVLDEPTSALDVSVQAHVLDLLAGLQQRLGLTYIFITHDLGVVRTFCSRVAVMYGGRIVEMGQVDEIFGRPRHRYTTNLLSSVPTISEEDEAAKPAWPWASSPVFPDGGPNDCGFLPRCPFATEECRGAVPPMVEVSPTHRHRCAVPNVIDTVGVPIDCSV